MDCLWNNVKYVSLTKTEISLTTKFVNKYKDFGKIIQKICSMVLCVFSSVFPEKSWYNFSSDSFTIDWSIRV